MLQRTAKTGAELFEMLEAATEVRAQIKFAFNRQATNWYSIPKEEAERLFKQVGIEKDSKCLMNDHGYAQPFGSLVDDHVLYLENYGE